MAGATSTQTNAVDTTIKAHEIPTEPSTQQPSPNSRASTAATPEDSEKEVIDSENHTSNQSSVDVTATTPNAAAFPGPSPQDPEASRTKLQTTIIMLSLCASVFLAALDVSIITTALPTISEHFHSNAGYTWIGSAYLLANAASTPSWGKFSDIWGRKPILLIAAGVFFIGSLLAATSVSIGMLIVARAIQGIGGGGLIILVNICISDLFSMRKRGAYFGLIGMTWAFASAIGPLLGGVFTQKVSWRWCFYINLPITGTVAIALFFYLHLDNPKTPVWDGLKAVDWFGSLLIIGGTLMVLLGLEFGGVTKPWDSATVICLIIFGIVVAGLFVLNEWKFARYPVMPLRLFKHASNVAALGVCFCHGFVFISASYYLPLYFQAVLGATPLLSGVYLLPFALSLSLTSAITGVFIKKTGKYLPPIYFGLVVMTLGFGLFINLPRKATWSKIIIYQIIAGIGVGPNFQSPLIALQTLVKKADIATATATFGFTRNLSTSISVVVGSVVFQNEMQKKSAELIKALGSSVALELSGGSAGASVDIVKDLPAAGREVARDAYWGSLRIMWIIYVAFAALGLAISFAIGQHVLSKEHETTKVGLAEQEKLRLEAKRAKKATDVEAGVPVVQANGEGEKALA
ncbi:putative major facilitator superfamily transporter protein [Botrytis fragariae]|uniref:Efflux pump dotC n=1 Tax=Botrytis fragariae TaxID=1964551 RepID=A0A8H6AR28_9HELO|nr:putative major facilitator superfamily transporter protein [Botrytis fragariae]KAF5872064.1 putative major facilitator superfamily transporter protein [Botrytis fragariae]